MAYKWRINILHILIATKDFIEFSETHKLLTRTCVIGAGKNYILFGSQLAQMTKMTKMNCTLIAHVSQRLQTVNSFPVVSVPIENCLAYNNA